MPMLWHITYSMSKNKTFASQVSIPQAVHEQYLTQPACKALVSFSFWVHACGIKWWADAEDFTSWTDPTAAHIMNSVIITLLAFCVALSAASYAPTYYQPGFHRGWVKLNYTNAYIFKRVVLVGPMALPQCIAMIYVKKQWTIVQRQLEHLQEHPTTMAFQALEDTSLTTATPAMPTKDTDLPSETTDIIKLIRIPCHMYIVQRRVEFSFSPC